MKRIVLDTNILVSGYLWDGLPGQILHLAREQRIKLVSSDALYAELLRVVSRQKFVSQLTALGTTFEEVVSGYQALSEKVEPAIIDPVITADPTDDKILACALGGKVDFIVSGDSHLRELGTYADIPIVTVNQFLEQLASEEPAE